MHQTVFVWWLLQVLFSLLIPSLSWPDCHVELLAVVALRYAVENSQASRQSQYLVEYLF